MNSKIALFSLLISVFITFCMAAIPEPAESYAKENVCQKKARAGLENALKKCTGESCRFSTRFWSNEYEQCPKGDLYTLCRVDRGAFNACTGTVRQLEGITKEQCEEESKKTYKHGTGVVFPPSGAYCILGPKRNCFAAFCS